MEKLQAARAWSNVVRFLNLAGGREKVKVFEADLKQRKVRGWLLGIRLAAGQGYLRRDGDDYHLTQKAYDHFSLQFERDYRALQESEEAKADALAVAS